MKAELTPLTHLRRALHRIPELGFEEHATHAYLADLLAEVGSPQVIAGTGFMVDLGPQEAPRTVLLRADMDGLPLSLIHI